MNKPQIISTAYKPYNDPAFIDLGENILAGLANNVNYPSPPTSLADLTKLLSDLNAAVQAMKTGLKSATPQRNFLRTQAEKVLKEVSAYATGATPARPDLWAAANFPLTKAETTPRPDSQPVTGLLLADGPSARTLLATVDRQKGMYGYQWRIYPKGTTAEELAAGFCYRFCVSRQPKILIENLDSGTTYYVECAAWNDSGPLQWSAPVSRIVQ